MHRVYLKCGHSRRTQSINERLWCHICCSLVATDNTPGWVLNCLNCTFSRKGGEESIGVRAYAVSHALRKGHLVHVYHYDDPEGTLEAHGPNERQLTLDDIPPF